MTSEQQGARFDGFHEAVRGHLALLEQAVLQEHERAFTSRKRLSAKRSAPHPPWTLELEMQQRLVRAPRDRSGPLSPAAEECRQETAWTNSVSHETGAMQGWHLPDLVPLDRSASAPEKCSIEKTPIMQPILTADKSGGAISMDMSRISHSQHASEMSLPDSPLSCARPSPLQGLGEASVNSEYSMFKLHDAWMQQHASLLDKVAHKPLGMGPTRLPAIDTPTHTTTDVTILSVDGDPKCGMCVISPTSPIWIAWNINYIFFLMYELIFHPLQVFDLDNESQIIIVLALASACFWTLDILFVLSVGYISSGTIVKSRTKIAMRYAKSWLFPDLALVVIDWVLLLEDHVDAPGVLRLLRGWKVLRYVRFMRALRVARLHRVPDFMLLLDDAFHSELMAVWKSVFVNIVGVAFASHLLACGWYFVGRKTAHNYRSSWVVFYDMEDATIGTQYFTSLHWSLCQLTPGSMDVQPQNMVERIYNCVVLMLGVVVFSSIISSITSGLTALKNIHGRYDRQRFMLRRFLREHDVSHEVSSRVLQYSDATLKPMQKMIRKHEVELLTLLPKSLYMDVVLELFDRYLEVHPLFEMLQEHNKLVLKKVCCTALEQVLLSKLDVLFSPGQASLHMYFVIVGKLNYWHGNENTQHGPKTWFCEAALWTNWIHQGEMSAVVDSELLSIDSSAFRQVMAQHHGEMMLLKAYGTEFVYGLNKLAGFFEDQASERTLTDTVHIPSALAVTMHWGKVSQMSHASRHHPPREGSSRPHGDIERG